MNGIGGVVEVGHGAGKLSLHCHMESVSGPESGSVSGDEDGCDDRHCGHVEETEHAVLFRRSDHAFHHFFDCYPTLDRVFVVTGEI